MKQRVIARAYAGEPLDRLAVGVGHGLIYIINPVLDGTDREAALWSIGFPEYAVYEFDEATYERILAAYLSPDRRGLMDLWKTARPLKAALPDIDAVIGG